MSSILQRSFRTPAELNAEEGKKVSGSLFLAEWETIWDPSRHTTDVIDILNAAKKQGNHIVLIADEEIDRKGIHDRLKLVGGANLEPDIIPPQEVALLEKQAFAAFRDSSSSLIVEAKYHEAVEEGRVENLRFYLGKLGVYSEISYPHPPRL